MGLRSTHAFFSENLGQHATDIWGVALIVLGSLMGLGMLFDEAGPFGRWIQAVGGAALGRAMLALPVALVVVGYVLLRETDRSESLRAAAWRVLIGLVMASAAACGLFHIRSGGPTWGSPFFVLRRAGGLVGATAAEPLQAFLGTGGAVLVLVVWLVLSVLIIVRVTVREAFNRTADGMRPARSALWTKLTALFEIDGDHDHIDASQRRHPTRGRVDRERRVEGFYEIPVYDDPLPVHSDAALPGGVVAEFVADGLDAGIDAVAPGAGGRRRKPKAVVINLPPEPEWIEEQPPAENIALPGLGADVGGVTAGHDVPAKARKARATRAKTDDASRDIAWKLPPRALLKKGKPIEIDKRAVEALGRTLEEALAAHGVETRLAGMTVGPTVTRYELELGPGVKVARVTTLHKDIAYAMATADVRVLAPIPGKSAIGVEVPNRVRQLVNVGDVLNTTEAKARTAPLTVAIGRDIDGLPVLVDLAKMPHVLVAGTTGSGKSSCINSLITSILMRSTPDQVRMILIDPKMVELSQYNGLPHLLTPVVTNPKKAASALAWAVDEMERRYELLAKLGFRDIGGYNAAVDKGELDDPDGAYRAELLGAPAPQAHAKLATILLIIDELADLMMVSAKDVEDSIVRIAQKARAVGIHLVVATQRPSVNVITGLIKANIPGRFAFAVSTLVDSRVIIDQPGAERLIGQGDMLMVTVSSNIPQRVQGNFVSEDEVRAIVGFWKRQASEARAIPPALPGVDRGGDEPGTKQATQAFVDFSSDAGRAATAPSFDVPGPDSARVGADPFAYGGVGELVGSPRGALPGDDDDDGDDMLDAAMELVVRSQLGSTSMLQRKLRVGFSRAGRIMDLLERRGVVGPSVGSKAREVLMTVEELEALLSGASRS